MKKKHTMMIVEQATMTVEWQKEKYKELEDKMSDAIALGIRYGGIDGSHHKDWVIDQMIRLLSGREYDDIIKDACDGEDGPNSYEWSEGTAP